MDNTKFTKLAEDYLQNLCERIENSDNEGDLDVDYLDGILNIELPDGGQYVINKHEASGKIWLSSPVSGANYFSYRDELWLDDEDNELDNILKGELQQFVSL